MDSELLLCEQNVAQRDRSEVKAFSEGFRTMLNDALGGALSIVTVLLPIMIIISIITVIILTLILLIHITITILVKI